MKIKIIKTYNLPEELRIYSIFQFYFSMDEFSSFRYSKLSIVESLIKERIKVYENINKK